MLVFESREKRAEVKRSGIEKRNSIERIHYVRSLTKNRIEKVKHIDLVYWIV